MWLNNLLLVLGLVHATSVLAQWTCTLDSECSDLQGSVCVGGACGCPTGQQVALSGTACVDLAPYHTSSCVEDHQCSRLFMMFQCRRQNETEAGACLCQPGFHYFLGRCWPTVDYGGSCSRDEECIGTPRNPYSLQCTGTCACADGYYERQRGECRKIGYAVGDGCVIDQDCQFTNGECDIDTRRCVLGNASRIPQAAATPVVAVTPVNVTVTAVKSDRSHGVACSATVACSAPFECSTFGACVCPIGYYLSDDGLQCNAELGSRSTEVQCVGLLAEVIDGICTCPPNFFFEENMRDCVKVTRRITDSCVSDASCHTFGAAARCAAAGAWGLRACGCDAARAVWDPARDMCRLFAGIGEECEVDSDCLAGELEIQCIAGQCACPAGLVPADGLCLTTGLAIGDTCQASAECTETANTVCVDSRCSCGDGYQELDDFCAAVIGGTCDFDSDCVIEDTVCAKETDTCQCSGGFVAYEQQCWPVSTGFKATCNVTRQCMDSLGENSVCSDGVCVCDSAYHHRDGSCWPITDLFEPCSRSSQCFLPSSSEKVVCRNSVCQCDFDYPYNEELRTCEPHSSASAVAVSLFTISIALMYLIVS